VWLAGKTVWSTPERLRGEVLTTKRYTNLRLPLPYLYIFTDFCRKMRNLLEYRELQTATVHPFPAVVYLFPVHVPPSVQPESADVISPLYWTRGHTSPVITACHNMFHTYCNCATFWRSTEKLHTHSARCSMLMCSDLPCRPINHISNMWVELHAHPVYRSHTVIH